MEFAAVAQKRSQEHLQSLLASREVVEPLHADPRLLETWSGKEPLSLMRLMTGQNTYQLHTTVTGGVVVRTVVET